MQIWHQTRKKKQQKGKNTDHLKHCPARGEDPCQTKVSDSSLLAGPSHPNQTQTQA